RQGRSDAERRSRQPRCRPQRAPAAVAQTGLLARWKMAMTETRSYPRHVNTDAGDIEFRLMGRADEAAVLSFAQRLPTHDLLFLPRNISQPKVLSAWIKEIERGDITSLLAVKDGAVVGCGTLVRDHVRDVTGKKHDIVVLGHNVAQVQAQLEAYGLPGAVQH